MATGIAPEYPTVYQGKAIAIYRYLSDGDWHHAKEIAAVVGLGAGTTRNLMGALREPFGLSVNTRKGYRLEPTDGAIAMTGQFMREQALQRKYPPLTHGKIITKDAQTLAYLISRGWEPNDIVTVESAYITGPEDDECLIVRWGVGQADWSGVLAEGFEAIEMDKSSII